jgi:hydrocephalus-inducing protein
LERKTYEAQAILRYDELEAYIPISGNAINGNVYLNKTFIELDEAYITLETQQTLQIINKSNVKIDFQWRAFMTEKEELEKKHLLKMQLDEEEAEKRLMLKETATLEHNHDMLEIQDDDDSDYEEVDEKTLMLKKQKKAELLLQRKYKNIKKAIEDNLLLFQDDTFTIEPQTGSIWPNSEMTITVTFKPKAALKYSCSAYCNISCSDERLLLYLEGEGLGPKAFLSTNNISIGDIFVNDARTVYCSMENKGEINATFNLIKNNTPFSNMIKFDVEEGILEVGQRLNFTVTFQSSKVGEFQEIFRIKLDGSSDMLTLLVRGHVRAPSFEFNKKKIDFGKVSYMFEETKDIILENTSTVPFNFHLRIPGDGKNNQKEFEIIPENDVIPAGVSKKISVKFMPQNRKQYFMVMVLDIEGVGKDMKSIPIIAESDVPNVKVRPEVLNFGEVFLRYPYTNEIELINESNLCARFKIHPQNPDTLVLGKYSTDLDQGQIMPESNLKLHVTLFTGSISKFTLELNIEIVSPSNIIHTVKLIAESVGPKVIVSEKELDFGPCVVLFDYPKKILISNQSSIEADFHAFTKNKISIFKPIQRHDILPPDKSMEIEIICTADDTVKFNDTLHIVIKEGLDVDVNLKARGTGTTLFCKEALNLINFGIQYTFRNQTKEIFLENKGRRAQRLTWARKAKPIGQKKEETGKPSKAVKAQPEEESITFTIIPETILLPPKNGIMFQFRANSTKKGMVDEEFTLSSTVGNERKATILHHTKVEGHFINPSLNFSQQKVYFKYTWQKNVPSKPLSQNIEIVCGSILPTNFDLVIDPPFKVYPDRFSLLPGKSATARLDFDPSLKHDRISDTTKKKLQVRHYKHPHVEYVDVIGEVCFPNLKMETSVINFGSV